MDYELFENAPAQFDALSKKPSEYFRSNWYATFWFEENQGDVQGLLDKVGEDRVLFETDFPHPTCLYPSPLETVATKMGTLRPETRRKVMGENAARLYRVRTRSSVWDRSTSCRSRCRASTTRCPATSRCSAATSPRWTCPRWTSSCAASRRP
jgi:hypothetical protein